jgi:hypothetical protein
LKRAGILSVGLALIALAASTPAAPVTSPVAAPPSTAAELARGAALEKTQHYAAAAEAYRSALAADPDSPEAEAGLGRCLAAEGWNLEALGHLNAALDEGLRDSATTALAESLTAQGEELGVLDADDAALVPVGGPWGLELEGGYGWGLNASTFGRRYNRDGNATPFTYDYNIGEGVLARAGLSADFSPGWGFGLSTLPLLEGTSGSESITYAGVSTTTDTTNLSLGLVPVLADVHTRVRLARNLFLKASFGAGAAFAQPYKETSTDAVIYPGGSQTTTVQYQRSYAPGPAFDGSVALHFQATRSCLLFLRTGLTWAQVQPTSATYFSRTYNASGRLVAESTVNDSYVSSPPKTQAVDATTTVSGSTTTYTYDNGPTQYTEVVQPGSDTVVADTFTESNVLGVSSGLLSYKVLSLSAGLRWEF